MKDLQNIGHHDMTERPPTMVQLADARRAIREAEESVTALSIAASASWIAIPILLATSDFLAAHRSLIPCLLMAFCAAALQALTLFIRWRKATCARKVLRLSSTVAAGTFPRRHRSE